MAPSGWADNVVRSWPAIWRSTRRDLFDIRWCNADIIRHLDCKYLQTLDLFRKLGITHQKLSNNWCSLLDLATLHSEAWIILDRFGGRSNGAQEKMYDLLVNTRTDLQVRRDQTCKSWQKSPLQEWDPMRSTSHWLPKFNSCCNGCKVSLGTALFYRPIIQHQLTQLLANSWVSGHGVGMCRWFPLILLARLHPTLGPHVPGLIQSPVTKSEEAQAVEGDQSAGNSYDWMVRVSDPWFTNPSEGWLAACKFGVPNQVSSRHFQTCRSRVGINRV